MPSIVNLPTIETIAASTTPYSQGVFEWFLPVVLMFIGLAVAAVIIVAVWRAIMRAVRGTFAGRRGRRGRRR